MGPILEATPPVSDLAPDIDNVGPLRHLCSTLPD